MRLWYDRAMEIKGLTAIVTGASGRLGQAIAAGLAAQRVNCVCHYHTNAETVTALVDQITAAGGRAIGVQADLCKEKDISELINASKKLGAVRILINSASIFERHPLEVLDAATIQRTLSVNLNAPMLTSRYFVKLLSAAGLDYTQTTMPFAKIINLSDAAAQKPWAEYAAYCASKSGLTGLTRVLSKELAPGITVNGVAPGIITWPEPMNPAEERKQLGRIPAGRFGRPEEIVRSILFLLANDYITGQTITVDGGRSL